VMLPVDNADARTLLIRDCTYNGSSVTTWDADLVSVGSAIDDELKRDILGARRTILFVEGNEQSLDRPLYSLVFPDVSVIAKGSCRDVARAVLSIRDADPFHWLRAFGLVDNDRRPQIEIDRLKEGGVHALATFSVEGIYYDPEIQGRVARKHAGTTGGDFAKCIVEAKAAALSALSPHVRRLSERAAERRIREEFFAHIPSKDQISTTAPMNVLIDIPKIVGEEHARLQAALSARDLVIILSRYPVRETPALDVIARKLGFQNRTQYEGAVRKLLIDDIDAITFVRSLFGTLPSDITGGGSLGGGSATT
jgi:hypothetical protein